MVTGTHGLVDAVVSLLHVAWPALAPCLAVGVGAGEWVVHVVAGHWTRADARAVLHGVRTQGLDRAVRDG